MERSRKTLIGLLLFNAVSAIGGGICLAAGVLGVPTSLLRHTPFDTFVVPGIFLGAVIGGSALLGATALLAHSRRSLFLSATAGAILVGWIIGETVLIEGFSVLQGLYLVTGLVVVAASVRLFRSSRDDTAPRGDTPTQVGAAARVGTAAGASPAPLPHRRPR